jgi:predicted negative regulator of RcsB-dependent stress response
VDDYKSEKEQWEDIKGWLKENGAWIVTGAALGVGIIYGYRYWQVHQDSHAVAAHERLDRVVGALNRNKRDDALKALGELDADYSRTPYGDQARLAIAGWYVEQGKTADAVAPLTKVMNDSHDDVLRLVARLRLARVLLEQKKVDEALALLDAAGSSAFDPRYQEIRGDALLAKGDRAAALAAYRAAAGSTVPYIINEDLLKLKIADLADVAPPPAETAAVAKDVKR